MKLAVIIVNYNTPADTIDCLESLKKTTQPEGLTLKTILVDNASKDDSVDLFSQKYPEIELIISPKNLGFAGGHNLGLKASLKHRPTHLLLINPDTLVPKDFFTSIYKSAINHPKVGLVTPKIYFAKGFEFHQNYQKKDLGKVIWSAGGKFDWANVLGSNDHVDEIDTGQFKTITDTTFATGACLLMKTEVVKNIGFLNEDYFLYLEDLEFCTRAKNFGWRIVFDPSIYLWHKVSQSSGIGSSLNDYFITRNRLLFGMKYTPFRTKFALLREAFRKLAGGSSAQKVAIKDFLFHRLGKGSFLN